MPSLTSGHARVGKLRAGCRLMPMDRKAVLLVDGYNVIRNNSRYSKLGTDYESASAWNKAREAVINDAALMAKGAFERCVVVFDAAGNKRSKGKPMRVCGIEVVFSPAGVSADTVIERLAHDAREAGREVVVVSSDFTIQSTVFGGGVTRMSASGFSTASDDLEDEWHDSAYKVGNTMKNTVAGRIDPNVAQRLNAFVRGKGDL